MAVERPLIAVSTSEIRRSQAVAPTPQGEPPQHEMALGLKYLRAVEAAGGLPVFAICRGMQVLNVARGGTLHQHLPDVVGDGIAHRQPEPGRQTTHWTRAFNQAAARLAFAV